jgi:hypothetical protein
MSVPIHIPPKANFKIEIEKGLHIIIANEDKITHEIRYNYLEDAVIKLITLSIAKPEKSVLANSHD